MPLLLAIVVLFLIVTVPLLGIWALNTLFSLSIPFTLSTWAAALLLICLIGGRKS